MLSRAHAPGRWISAALSLAIVFMAGCTDLPTGAEPLGWFGGESAGLLPPSTLPDLSAWSASIAAGPAGAEVRERVHQLEMRSLTLLGRGRFAEAAATREQAVDVLSAMVQRAPDASLLDASRLGIAEWVSHVRGRMPETVSSRLDAELALIDAARIGAETALDDGDSIGAARSLMRASEQIRVALPLTIAAHAVWQSDQQVRALPEDASERVRAEHLIRSAREALAQGEVLLAARRAVYAGQIAEGRGIDEPAADTLD